MAEQQTPLYATFMRQFDLAREEVEKMRQAYPGCFDAAGEPLIATARMPALHTPTKEQLNG